MAFNNVKPVFRIYIYVEIFAMALYWYRVNFQRLSKWRIKSVIYSSHRKFVDDRNG
jgi:hypothetical protein